MRGTVAVIGIVILLVIVSHMNRERGFAEEEQAAIVAASGCEMIEARCHLGEPTEFASVPIDDGFTIDEIPAD